MHFTVSLCQVFALVSMDGLPCQAIVLEELGTGIYKIQLVLGPPHDVLKASLELNLGESDGLCNAFPCLRK